MNNESLARRLASELRMLQPVLEEHLEDQDGELIPYVFMAEVARWADQRAATEPDEVGLVTAWLDAEFASGSEEIKDLIGVGFVEMLPATPARRPRARSAGTSAPPGRPRHALVRAVVTDEMKRPPGA